MEYIRFVPQAGIMLEQSNKEMLPKYWLGTQIYIPTSQGQPYTLPDKNLRSLTLHVLENQPRGLEIDLGG